MNRFLRISPLAMVVVGGAALMAQSTTGALVGTVKNNSGAAVAGARVSIESPQLFAPRVVTTDANGEYRAPLLPPGTYSVTVTKDGFVSAKVGNIRIGLGASARQDATLQAAAAPSATVVVTSSAGEVDKTDTKASTNFSSEDLLALPGVDRSFYGAADLAPGLVTSRDGGSFNVRGGASQQTNFRVNGIDVKDDYQGSLTGNYVIEDNIEDVQVILSPLNARNGRATGGSVNVVTKSGGNDFSGSIRADLSRNAWDANNSDKVIQAGSTNDRLNRNYQVTLSGPIIKDRLWFAVGAILTPSNAQTFTMGIAYPANTTRSVATGNTNVDTVTLAGPGNGFAFSKYDQGLPYTRISDSNYFEGKITGAITVDHTLEASFTKSKNTLAPRNPFGDGSAVIVRLAALGTQEEKTKAWGVSYRGVLSSSTFIEARYNRSDPSVVFPSGDPHYGSGEGLYVYQGRNVAGSRTGFGFPFGIGISPTPDSRANRSGNFNLKHFLDAGGQHELDLGVDYYEFVRGTSRSSGLRNLFFRVGGMYTNAAHTDFIFPVINNIPGQFGQAGDGVRGPAPSVIQYTQKDGTTRNKVQSAYANDQWTIDKHWNVMLGLRFDQNSVVDTDGAQIAKKSDVSPRFQARYDLKGDSQHLFTFTAARFYGDFTGGFTDAFIKKADSASVNRGWNANPYAPGSAADPTGLFGVRFIDYNTITNLANYGRVLAFADNSKTYQVDPGLGSPYLDEYTLAYRRTYTDGSHFGLTYVHRQWKNDWGFASDYQPDGLVTLTDPTGSGLPNQQAQTIQVRNDDRLKREYNGLELEWLSKINATWVWGGNYTYSRLVGNNNGGDQGVQSFRDNAVPSIFANRNQLLNVLGRSEDDFAPTGPLIADQTHRARLYLTASLPLGKGKVSYSWLLRYDSGNNWSASNTAPLGFVRLPAPAPSAPQAYTQFYGGRGQYSYNDTYTVDFKVDFHVPLGFARTQLIGSVQVNNLLNTQMVSTYNTSIYAPTAGINQLYVNDATAFGTTEPNTGNAHSISARTLAFSLGIKF